MPTCPWTARVLALLDREEVDPACADHLEGCPACRQALDAAAGPLPQPPEEPPAPEPPPELLERLHALARATGGRLPEGFRPEVDGIEVFEEVGRGGMGVVFRARQMALGRVVALKVLHPAAIATPEAFGRAVRATRALARVGHPGLVQVLHVGQSNGLRFGVLEYVDGGSLAARLDGRPLPPEAAARLVRRLAEAVQVLHGQGLIHRDIKPGNVLLAYRPGAVPQAGASLADCQPKLADFGLTRPVGADDLTETGAVLGSPGWMAPEQARGGKDLGPACDVYALGGILYELLTGRPPFTATSATEAVDHAAQGMPEPIGRLAPGVPRELGRICERCLEPEPDRRYPDAGRLAADLAAFLGRGPA
ncbi:MAG: serine/threonine protein kinase, partial [Gemmataceae bacterium]|nr:serine/threonine protein kinase [Gemmataceae bacterium]